MRCVADRTLAMVSDACDCGGGGGGGGDGGGCGVVSHLATIVSKAVGSQYGAATQVLKTQKVFAETSILRLLHSVCIN